MSFDVEYSDDGGSTFQAIQYGSFDVEYGLSDVLLAPLAAVDASRQVGASTGDRLRIQENGSNIFIGRLTTGGEVRSDGQTRLQAEHDIYSVFADSVSITVSNPTDEDVYDAALSAASGGGTYTLNYVGSATSLADDYDVDDRKVKRIFKDMTDRTDRVFYVGVGDTITVAPRGNGGQFADLNAGDGFRVEKYNPGDIDTVRNAVTVNGTGGEQVSATATDSTSISDFGRRAKVYNFSYIRSTGEASSMASELVIPDPLGDAELLLGRSISNTTDVQVNTTIDFNDADGSGASDVLTVEKQTISPGATTVKLGEGAGVSIANVRRDNQSVEDTTEPGSVYNTDRIADDAVESQKLVDSSVVTSKLADLAVQLDKVDDGAIDTVKISDDAIEAPKILAGTITANEIAADTLTATEIVAGTITALEIASDEITANEIDTLDLDTNQLEVGVDNTNKIEFETDVGGETFIVPESDATCNLGALTTRFSELFTQGATIDNATIFDGEFGSNLDEQIEIIPFGGGVADGTALFPTQDETCALGGLQGGSSKAFNSMRSHNFNTATPERLDAVDASEVTDYSFHEPPLCAAQNKDSSTESGYRRRNPSKTIEIGHITNYLFEVCKDQQETIESQADRIESLESTVADLQSRLADLEAKQE